MNLDIGRLHSLAAKVERGEELTESEQQEIQQFVEAIMPAIEALLEAVREAATKMAEMITKWWESVPEELKSMMKQSLDDRLKVAREPLQAPSGPLNGLIGQPVSIHMNGEGIVSPIKLSPLDNNYDFHRSYLC